MLRADLASELERMAEEDQAMRRRALENNGVIGNDADDTVDFRNTERMKQIVEEIGWPTISKVGMNASGKAWLLVQHADHDVQFQKQCLELMKSAQREDVDPAYIAYLEDRVRVNEGRPQLYGTQFFGEGDAYGPRPIEDPERVDERRKALGMSSMAEYTEALVNTYFKHRQKLKEE